MLFEPDILFELINFCNNSAYAVYTNLLYHFEHGDVLEASEKNLKHNLTQFNSIVVNKLKG